MPGGPSSSLALDRPVVCSLVYTGRFHSQVQLSSVWLAAGLVTYCSLYDLNIAKLDFSGVWVAQLTWFWVEGMLGRELCGCPLLISPIVPSEPFLKHYSWAPISNPAQSGLPHLHSVISINNCYFVTSGEEQCGIVLSHIMYWYAV